MEKTESKTANIISSVKREINWAKYLDVSKYFEPAEINNIPQEIFKKDFE